MPPCETEASQSQQFKRRLENSNKDAPHTQHSAALCPHNSPVSLGDQTSNRINRRSVGNKMKIKFTPPPNCSPPLRAAHPALARSAPSPETTATGISPASRRNSGIRRHQLAELDHSYKLMRRGTHQASILGNKARSPAAPRIHCSRCAPGDPTTNELARRSGAILHAAGILQRLVRLGGKKESRNPPASA